MTRITERKPRSSSTELAILHNRMKRARRLQRDKSMPENQKTKFELFVELIKVLAWPTFAFFILFSFWGSFRSVARLLPEVLGRSQSITIAGMSLEIGSDIGREAPDGVSEILSDLPPSDIRILMNFRGPTFWDYAGGYRQHETLMQAGLLEAISQDELNQRIERTGNNTSGGIRLTPLGQSAQDYLMAIVSSFVDQIEERTEQ